MAGFADIARPQFRPTEEKRTLWSPGDTAFQSLEGALCAAHVLGYP
jgi:hypothetical protein